MTEPEVEMTMEDNFAPDQDGDDVEGTAANIERYLNDHTREGGRAWEMNMAARPQSWHPLETAPEHPEQTRTDA